MPHGALPNFFRNRAATVALVAAGHVALLALLLEQHVREAGARADERMTLVFIDLPEPRAMPAAGTARVARHSRPVPAGVPASSPAGPATGDSAAITPEVDWYAQGRDAAARATVEPTTRAFDFPKREPAPRERKEFGWDKTHTERVHALDGGGIGIHLSDNCELIIAPLPMAGCGLGRRKARGDLFDEMKAPPEMGDWKEH